MSQARRKSGGCAEKRIGLPPPTIAQRKALFFSTMPVAPLQSKSSTLIFKIPKMAATREANEAWKSFYIRGLKEPGELFEIGKQPLSFFDDISDAYFEDEKELLEQVEANPVNFIVVPGPLRTVRIIHNVFTMNGGKSGQRAIGVLGTR
jgi:hypothetical protein